MAWLVANWKMNNSVAATEKFFSEIPADVLALRGVAIGVAPMAPLIPSTLALAKRHGILIGAQNAHWDDSGSFTGEVSATLLKELGCDFVIVGHSERRHLFRESIEEAARRAIKVLSAGLTAIFCVGETNSEREAGRTNDILSEQLAPIFPLWNETFAGKFVIAYEPVWAIGTGKSATLPQIQEAHAFIRELVKSKVRVPVDILYGGSVSPENAAEILALPNVSGALVGKASLNAASFATLCRAAKR